MLMFFVLRQRNVKNKVYHQGLSVSIIYGLDKNDCVQGYRINVTNVDNRLCNAGESGILLLQKVSFILVKKNKKRRVSQTGQRPRPPPKALKGLLIMSGLRGLMGRANRSSSASWPSGCCCCGGAALP